MNTDLTTLYTDLIALCEKSESFYYIDQVKDGVTYRVFTYRLASFTEFQNRNAIECRGHTFRNDNGEWVLASLPMHKFFNYGEHIGWGAELDLNSIEYIMDKADGSLISTVDSGDNFFLKSKTSFKSAQAADATEWINRKANQRFREAMAFYWCQGFTVNCEWVGPSNQIVIGYPENRLIVLNVRKFRELADHGETSHQVGEYVAQETVIKVFGADNVVQSVGVPADPAQFITNADKMTGIEGFIIRFKNGLWVKHKTEAYCTLHHLKDSINNDKRLWAACVNETADDLRALFRDDPMSVNKISAMEEKASHNYNHLHKLVYAFFKDNKHLDRKSYAIKGQAELAADGVFSLAMNLYLGKECDIKAFMIKNYKNFDISDTENVEVVE